MSKYSQNEALFNEKNIEHQSPFSEFFINALFDQEKFNHVNDRDASKLVKIISNLKNILEETSLLVIVNREGKIVYGSESICNLLRCNEDDLINKHYLAIQHHSFQKHDQASFSSILGTKDVTKLNMYAQTKKGQLIVLETTIFPIEDSELFLLTHKDLTQLKKIEQAIEELEDIDILTGLPNRDKFKLDILNLLGSKSGGDPSFAILFLDLDRFKFYNDTLGHTTGDKLIQAIALALSEIKYEQIQVYRYGGDEFSIILHTPDSKEEITSLAKILLETFQMPFMVDKKELFITASIGISFYPEFGHSYEDIVHQAHIGMHYAKERGKNDYEWYHPSLRTKYGENLSIERRLRVATEKKAFQLYYQPQIDLKEKRVTGVEALIRWDDEEIGSISPVQFIPIAEETGLITPIGDWVLEEACRQTKEWHDQGCELKIGINISPIQFQRPDFYSKVKTVIKKTGIRPELVDLEITENDMIFDKVESVRMLERLKSLGINISIDDFGTGYSSFSYLRNFPIDTLKIDRSFIRDVLKNKNDQAIVSSIIQLAHQMNLTVIAEGVETADMVKFLNEHECDEMQGFLYSKALPPDELAEFIHHQNPVHLLQT